MTQYASFHDGEGILYFETQGNKFIKETHLNGLNHNWEDFFIDTFIRFIIRIIWTRDRGCF